MQPTIWHNPRCGTSRNALALLEARGHAPKVRLYLSDPPDAAEIARVLKLLRVAPQGLVRLADPPPEAEAAWSAAGTDDERVAAMAEHPILIQRPVVIAGRKAALVRPKAEADAILDALGL